jgi:hypothetical protein
MNKKNYITRIKNKIDFEHINIIEDFNKTFKISTNATYNNANDIMFYHSQVIDKVADRIVVDSVFFTFEDLEKNLFPKLLKELDTKIADLEKSLNELKKLKENMKGIK